MLRFQVVATALVTFCLNQRLLKRQGTDVDAFTPQHRTSRLKQYKQLQWASTYKLDTHQHTPGSCSFQLDASARANANVDSSSMDYGGMPMTATSTTSSSDVNGNTEQDLQSGYDTKGEYERFLYSVQRKRRQSRLKKALQERELEKNEDGYENLMGIRHRSWWQRALFYPLKSGIKLANSAARLVTGGELVGNQPGRLILVRHGESEWNANKTFTGWADPDLSEKGIRETEHAARLLLAGGYDIDVVFTSRLKRAIRSTWIILGEINQLYLPVFKSWRLNERMYGALTGLGKTETAETLGVDLVQKWRGSLNSRPPALRPNDYHWPGRDRRYSDLTPSQIPLTESLQDCMVRTEPVWEDKIKFELQMGRNVMVVGHANTLRGLVKLIDNIGDEEIQEVAIPTGIPIVYRFDKQMNPIRQETDTSNDSSTLSQKHMSGVFLEKPGLLKKAMQREQEWCDNVPGFTRTMTRVNTPMTPLERSLFKLQAIGELGEWATQFFDPSEQEEDDGSDGNMGKPIQLLEDAAWAAGMQELEHAKAVENVDVNKNTGNNTSNHMVASNEPHVYQKNYGGPENPEMVQSQTASELVSTSDSTLDNKFEVNFVSKACITAMPSSLNAYGATSTEEPTAAAPIRRDPVLVLIRHGKTEHNKLGLFTGWEDAPLAPEGRAEATAAGQLLRTHGFEFDLVYTSWLSRAREY
jgi:2,3-bisphosphoglycerate-dependent phosphoglycerate mutase